MTTIAVLINPVSGGGRGNKIWAVMAQGLRAIFDTVTYRITNYLDDIGQLVRDLLTSAPDYLLIIGGDGTLNHAINGLFCDDKRVSDTTQVAYYNAGCGGDFGRLFPKQHMTSFIETLTTRRPVSVDVGKICIRNQSARYFINIASCGLSAEIGTMAQHSRFIKKLGGPVNYLVHSLLALLRSRLVKVKVTIDEQPPFDCRMLLMALANGQFFGGNMKVAPLATFDDGLLDVVIFRDFSRISALFKLTQLYRGRHLQDKQVYYSQGKHIVIESLEKAPIFIEADGEAVGQLPAQFELLPQALSLIL